jgi:hypothetical protein
MQPWYFSGHRTDEHLAVHPEREIAVFRHRISEIRAEIEKVNDTLRQKNAETSRIRFNVLRLRSLEQVMARRRCCEDMRRRGCGFRKPQL